MVENPPFVSVIIPTYKDWDRLARCIAALKNQTYPKKYFEVIIVNNDQGNPTPQFPLPENFKFLTEEKPGSYAARNTGILASKGEILAFTDSDCIPNQNWIKSAVIFLKKNRHIDFIGGKIVLVFKQKKLTLAEIYEKVFSFRQELILQGRKHAVTANMFVRKKTFNEIGLFDSNLFSTGDVEWGSMASRQGRFIGYHDETIVYHPARHTTKQLIKKTVRTSGGQFFITKQSLRRRLIVLSGTIPPILSLKKIKGRNDLKISEKIQAFLVLYFLRIVRSFVFILLELKLMNPSRT
jgi:glycosyltransferase involved in cell wall biosynthesis